MMNLLISAIITLLPPTNTTYDELLDMAAYKCATHASWGQEDDRAFEDLAKVEAEYFKKYGIPTSLKGMLLITACKDGDYIIPGMIGWPTGRLFDPGNGKKKSGILKLKFHIDKYWRKKYKNFGHNWMGSLIKQRNEIEKRKLCNKLSDEKKWVLAWLRIQTGYPSEYYDTRCEDTPSHYKALKLWHRHIQKARRNMVDGC